MAKNDIVIVPRLVTTVLITFQPALEFLESAHLMWDNTVNKAYRVKGEIQPLQNAAADDVRKDIAAFGEEVQRSLIFSHVFVTYGLIIAGLEFDRWRTYSLT